MRLSFVFTNILVFAEIKVKLPKVRNGIALFLKTRDFRDRRKKE